MNKNKVIPASHRPLIASIGLLLFITLLLLTSFQVIQLDHQIANVEANIILTQLAHTKQKALITAIQQNNQQRIKNIVFDWKQQYHFQNITIKASNGKIIFTDHPKDDLKSPISWPVKINQRHLATVLFHLQPPFYQPQIEQMIKQQFIATLLLSFISIFIVFWMVKRAYPHVNNEPTILTSHSDSHSYTDSEAKFRNILETAADSIITFDASFQIETANTSAYKLFNYNHDSLTAFDARQLLADNNLDEKEITTTHPEKSLNGVKSDGTVFPMLAAISQLQLADKTLYTWIIHDITRRKKVQQALHKEKELAQVTLQSIGEAVITINMDHEIEYMNTIAENLSGWSLDRVKNKKVMDVVKLIYEESKVDVPKLFDIQFENGNKKIHHKEPEQNILLINCHQNETPVEYIKSPIHDKKNNIMGMVLVLRDVSQSHKLARQLSHQAKHDALTGLINRREFEQRLKRAIITARSEKTKHILLYMDLDQFKVVNDTCGHVAGDELLRQVASMFRRTMRQRDTLARLGGDEFAVLLERCKEQQALRIANVLHQCIQDLRFTWQSKIFTIGISIGMVTITEQDENINKVLSIADTACYAAKDAGRNRIYVHKQEKVAIDKKYGEMQWVSKITQAFEDDRFFLYYQPIVPTHNTTNTTRHYEILIRMNDEEGNLVFPGAFLPAAERYNIMPTLDRWVIRTMFRWLQQHPKHLSQLDLCSINLSGNTLGDNYFLDFMFDQFEIYDIPPHKICFEITETAAITNIEKATAFIDALKAKNSKFALDDFGCGMSSFAYLKHLPVDFLKIDGMFVKDILDDPIDYAMVKSINEIGHVMGLSTIAEFVENEGIINKLKELGVNYLQGYGIAKPKPLSELLGE